MDWKKLVRQNMPLDLVRAIEELFPLAYQRAAEVAEAEFESNIPLHRGVARFGKCDDAFFNAGVMAKMYARRVPALNGMTHTEILSDECVFITKKVGEPGATGDAKYKNLLEKPNEQYSLFEDDDLEEIEIAESDPVLVEITHGPYEDDPSRLHFIYVLIPDGNGGSLDYFPLSSLYPTVVGKDSGVEEIPDNLPIKPKRQKSSGEDE